MAGHVFISYAREDSGHIVRLSRILREAGIPVWLDTADLWPGDNWRVKVRAAISGDAFAFLACFSRRSVDRSRGFHHAELAFALDEMRMRRPAVPWLIPVRLDECQIPDLEIGGGRSLADLQRADLFGANHAENADRLLSVIRDILELGPTTAGRLQAVVEAILAHLPAASVSAQRGKLPVAVELALCRAIDEFGAGAGKASLAWPLLDRNGFLADEENAAVLARAMTGGGLEGAPTLGRAWAGAFLDGTRAGELTADAESLLGYIWAQAQGLQPLANLADVSSRGRPPSASEQELRARLGLARERIADYDEVATSDIGRSGRNLPAELRFFLNDQTLLIAGASRGFVGRESVLARVKAFIEGDEDGYCFVLAKLGVGKTALLAHLVAGQPGYARHFNVLSEGVHTTEQFLNNVCAQLIGAYRLDPGLFPMSGNASTDLLLRLLKKCAAKARGDKVVVVIDALDEAMTGSRLPGVNPLTLPRSLPEGCRFVVAVREGTEGWEPTLDTGCAARMLCVDVSGEENMTDARAYVRSRLTGQGIAGFLRKQGLAGEEFADEVAVRSGGYFVYLRHVLDQYDAGGELASRDLAELPAGLMPYYDDQYERMRAGAPQRQWERVQLPVLIQLACADQPLTLYQLTSGAGQHEAAPVARAIEQWRPFLIQASASRNGRQVPAYRLFHESFREFLRNKHEHAAEVAEVERQLRDDLERQAQARYGPGGPVPL